MTVVSTTHPAHQIVPRATFAVTCTDCDFAHDSDAATAEDAMKAVTATHIHEGAVYVVSPIVQPPPLATLESRITGLEALVTAMDKTNHELRAENDKLRAEAQSLVARVDATANAKPF